MSEKNLGYGGAILAILIGGIGFCSQAGATPVLKTLHTFSDGANPLGRLIMDNRGNLYGTTCGIGNECPFIGGPPAVVYRLSPPRGAASNWSETILYTFGSQVGLSAGLTFDSRGQLYGVSNSGGRIGGGFVFRLTRPTSFTGSWVLSTLFNYHYAAENSAVDLVVGSDGGLYGTVSGGPDEPSYIMELSPPPGGGIPWDQSFLTDFGATPDEGMFPGSDRLAMDADGNLYGTTGAGLLGYGNAYELVRPANGQGPWVQKSLYTFLGVYGNDVIGPSGLVFDTHGNLFGTSAQGGASSAGDMGGYGTVFELIPPTESATAWTETILYNFTGLADGMGPIGEPVIDAKGNVYGVACGGGTPGYGTIFEVSPPEAGQTGWSFQVLYSFTGGTDGGCPSSALAIDAKGTLYGTTAAGYGTASGGTVFSLTP